MSDLTSNEEKQSLTELQEQVQEELQELEESLEVIADSVEEAKAQLLQLIQEKQQIEEELSRPKVGFKRYLFGLLLPLLIYGAEITTFILLKYSVWIFVPLLVVTFCVFFKPFLILSVLNYQRYAPRSLRGACRFTPSCSNYMLMAIEKYGTLKGFFKGVGRVLRCHEPNGGEDYP